MDVVINELTTDITVAEGVGTLSPEDVRKIVAMVMEHLREQRNMDQQRKSDVEIHDRAFRAGDR